MKLPSSIITVLLVIASGANAAVFTTGAKERTEASLDNKGSVARFGANTSASVGKNGQVQLQRGVMLVSSGSGFFRRSPVVVTTPHGDVTVRGSAILATMPDGSVKVTCLEGGMHGKLGGQNLSLHPGQLLVQREGAGGRDTMQVNLASLTTSSPLLGQDFRQSLPAVEKISHQAVQQLRSLVSSGAVVVQSSPSANGDARVTGQTIQIRGNNGTGVQTISGEGLTLSISNNITSTAAETVVAQQAPVSNSATSNQQITSTTGLTKIGATGVNIFAPEQLNLPRITDSAGLNLQATPLVSSSAQLVTGFSRGDATLQLSGSNITLAQTPLAVSSGTLVLHSSLGLNRNLVLTTGNLVISAAEAATFLNSGNTVTGTNGTTLTPVTNPDGSLTFSNPN